MSGPSFLTKSRRLATSAKDESWCWVIFTRWAGESGVPVDQPQGFLFTIDDGKVAVGRAFASQEQALEAARLRE
jgi:hypothetical protein